MLSCFLILITLVQPENILYHSTYWLVLLKWTSVYSILNICFRGVEKNVEQKFSSSYLRKLEGQVTKFCLTECLCEGQEVTRDASPCFCILEECPGPPPFFQSPLPGLGFTLNKVGWHAPFKLKAFIVSGLRIHINY